GPGLLVRALLVGVAARMSSIPRALAAAIGLGVFEQVLLWNNHSGGLVEAAVCVAMIVALLLQTRTGGREQEQGSWLAVQGHPPLPDELRAVWAIRHLGHIAMGIVLALLTAVVFTSHH